ncbi:hypothetical protein AB0L75_08430 [Streptomyces sp. NPDC052101]|uniref:hypothetical protein n=1 Tax=Streptomyces sp. NPDC052101 TaxID=3155763 RepID=UPI0034308920
MKQNSRYLFPVVVIAALACLAVFAFVPSSRPVSLYAAAGCTAVILTVRPKPTADSWLSRNALLVNLIAMALVLAAVVFMVMG